MTRARRPGPGHPATGSRRTGRGSALSAGGPVASERHGRHDLLDAPGAVGRTGGHGVGARGCPVRHTPGSTACCEGLAPITLNLMGMVVFKPRPRPEGNPVSRIGPQSAMPDPPRSGPARRLRHAAIGHRLARAAGRGRPGRVGGTVHAGRVRSSSSAGTPVSCSTAPARWWPRSCGCVDPSALGAFDRFEGYDPTRPADGGVPTPRRRGRSGRSGRPDPRRGLGLRAAGGAGRSTPGRGWRLAGPLRGTRERPP